jgi:serine/threonine protein phosphatase Stp1
VTLPNNTPGQKAGSSASNPIVLTLVAPVLAAASIFGGLIAASEIDIRYGESMFDWFRESLSAAVIFPILLIVALLARRLFGGPALKAGERPITTGIIALIAGVGLIAVVLQIAITRGDASAILPYSVPSNWISFLVVTGIFLVQATSEEVFFRGWLQGSLEQRVHPAIAIAVTAILFSGLHFVVEPRHFMSAVNLLLAGIVLGLIYRHTKGLVAPIMFHFGWNWAEAMLFGMTPNPGYMLAGSVSDFDLIGPLLFGGGEEGLNTSVVSAALLTLLGLVLLWLINRNPKGNASAKMQPASPIAKPESEKPVNLVEIASPMATPVRDAPVSAPLVSPVTSARVLSSVPNAQSGSAATLAATHPGAVREVNEDRFFTNEAQRLWAVADGMGGHRFGDRASTMIVETLATVSPTGSLEDRIQTASEAILASNRAIYLEAQENGSRMGSTVVALVVADGRYALIWAGDSRAYRLRNGVFEQLSKDHTQVQELVDRGEMTPEAAARHPMSHVLVKAIGVLENIELETMTGDIEIGDLFFLCSDGIYDALDDDEIAEQLMKRGADTNLDRLINLAVAQGARDNVTAIAIIPEHLPPGQPKTEGNLNS